MPTTQDEKANPAAAAFLIDFSILGLRIIMLNFCYDNKHSPFRKEKIPLGMKGISRFG